MEDNIKRMYILEDMQEIEYVLKNNITDIKTFFLFYGG